MKSLHISTAAAVLLGSAIASVSAVNAETTVVRETRSNVLACYNRVYVPARVLVDTRGVLVRKESEAWNISGDRWERVRNPPVFIQTRKTIEANHYTLVRC